MRYCNRPGLPAASAASAQHSSPPTSSKYDTEQPLLLIIDALAQTNLADKDSLQKIKRIVLRQDNLNKHLEQIKSGDKTFVESPTYSKENPLSIPNSRLKDMPHFNPIDSSPLANYMAFTNYRVP